MSKRKQIKRAYQLLWELDDLLEISKRYCDCLGDNDVSAYQIEAGVYLTSWENLMKLVQQKDMEWQLSQRKKGK